MNLEGVTLQTSLKQCLRQLDLAYAVDGELLLITSYEGAENLYHYRLSPNTDAFLIVGHCLLAKISAGLGAVAAPFVCRLARGPRHRDPGEA
jgi:hypothetical protein